MSDEDGSAGVEEIKLGFEYSWFPDRHDLGLTGDPSSTVPQLIDDTGQIMSENDVTKHDQDLMEDDDEVERRTMARLYQVICTQGDDIVKKELIAHGHFLDKKIIIGYEGNCSCPYIFEQYPVMGEGGDTSVLRDVMQMIRIGHCTCPPTVRSLYASRRLIHLAVLLGKIWLVDFLLDHGCSINVYTGLCKYSPLLLAILWRLPDMVKKLVERGAGLNQRSPDEKVPLIEAVQTSEVDTTILKTLLDSGRCKVNVTTEFSETALFVAWNIGNMKAVRMLLANKANPNVTNERGEPLLYLAVLSGSLDLVTALIKFGAYINATNKLNGETALHAAVRTGNSDIVYKLLANGADEKKSTSAEYTPAFSCLDDDEMYHILEGMLIRRALGPVLIFPCQDEHNDIRTAFMERNDKWWEILLHLGACPNALTPCRRWTPLALAAQGCFLETMPSFGGGSGDINKADEAGITPLHDLAYDGCSLGVDLLIEYGADPNVSDKFKTTPLWNAMYKKNTRIIRALVLSNVVLEISSRGIDLNVFREEEYEGDLPLLYPSERSVLWLAVDWGDEDIVKLLVNAGYNVWKEKWLLENDTEELEDDSLPLVHKLQSVIQQAPSLGCICRKFFRIQYRYSHLEYLVRTSLLPDTLKDFLLLKDGHLQDSL